MAKKRTEQSGVNSKPPVASGELTNEQQMIMANIQANPRLLFTPEYTQWRDYYRRNSQNYVDSLFNNLPKEVQDDIYNNDREGFGALSNKVKNAYKGDKGASMTREGMKEAGNTIGNVFWDEVAPYIPVLGTGKDWYDFYQDPTLGNLSWALIGTAADSGIVRGAKRIVNGFKGRQIVDNIDNVADARKSQFAGNFDIGKRDANVDLSDLVKRGLMSADDAANYAERIREAGKRDIQPILDEIKSKTRNEITKGVALTIGGLGVDTFMANEQQLQNEGLEPWLININSQPWSKYKVEDVPLMLRGVEPDSRDYSKTIRAYGGAIEQTGNSNMRRRMQSPANLFVAGGIADQMNLFETGGPGELGWTGQQINNNIIDRSAVDSPMTNYLSSIKTDPIQRQQAPLVNEYVGAPKTPQTSKGNGINADTIIAGATGIIGGTVGNATLTSKNQQLKNQFADESSTAASLANNNQFNYGASTTTGLLNQIRSTPISRITPDNAVVNWKDLRPSKGQQWANAGKAAGSGAAIGGMIGTIGGPVGTAIGAGIGALVGGASAAIGSLFGRGKAKREARAREQERQNAVALQNYSNQAASAQNQYAINNAINAQQSFATNNALANYHAYGGPIDPPKDSEVPSSTAVNNVRPDLDSTLIVNNRIDELMNKSARTTDQMTYDEVREKANQMIDAYSDPTRFKNTDMAEYVGGNGLAFGGMFDITPTSLGLFNQQMDVSRRNTIDKVKMNDGLAMNKFDFGGMATMPMGNNPDVTEVNAGGTHEQNPNMGVQVGVDSRGVPNLVEEGEVIWKRPTNTLMGKNLFAEGGSANSEYVFTNRWFPTDDLLAEVGIAKKPNEKAKPKEPTKSYADRAKDINKEAKERPNDPITKNTINKNLEKLAEAQEKERAMREAQAAAQEQAARRNMALGMNSMMGQGMNPMQDMVAQRQQNMPNEDQSLTEYNRGGTPMMMAYGGLKNLFAYPFSNPLINDPKYGYSTYDPSSNSRTIYGDPGDPPETTSTTTTTTSGNPPDGYPYDWVTGLDPSKNASNPFYESTRSGSVSSGERRSWQEVYKNVMRPSLKENVDAMPKAMTVSDRDLPTLTRTINMEPGYNTYDGPEYNPSLMRTSWLRYAPVVGSVFNVANDIAGKNAPDYSLVNKLEADANKGTFVPVSSIPVGNYLAYNPFDINYTTNKLNSQANATRRAMENASGGQRNNYLANLAAADYNSQIGIGEAMRQAYEHNIAQRQAVEGFNRDTNKFNSEEDLKAQMANQAALASLRQFKLSGLSDAAKLKYQMQMDDLSRRYANFTSLFNNLGEVGRDALNYNMVMSNPSLLYALSKNGTVDYKGEIASDDDEKASKKKKKTKKSEEATA